MHSSLFLFFEKNYVNLKKTLDFYEKRVYNGIVVVQSVLKNH